MERLAENPRLHLIPSLRAARLYDDKLAQAEAMERWMPRTIAVHDERDVDAALGQIGVPLISKASQGAGSYNVRLVETREAAFREAELIFSGRGIPLHFGEVQRDYLLWQEFLQGNAYDFRVIAVGRERLILRRGNRKDRPMASGSGIEMPVTFPDAEAESALEFADRFFAEEDMRFCGIDLVNDRRTGAWRLLECTTGWPLGKMALHTLVSGRPGTAFWDIVLDEIEASAC
jgi:glutathione synthase/RimK-type ligase-like ATP-grasp enzyme